MSTETSNPATPAAAPNRRYELSVCAEMLYRDTPMLDRFRRIAEYGLAIDLWATDDLDIPAALATGARFASMTGYAGGSLTDADSADRLVRSTEVFARRANELGIGRLVVHSAEIRADGSAVWPQFRPNGTMWMTALRALEQLADVGERYDVTFCLENLNTTVDHPGLPLARLADTHALVAAVGSDRVRLMLDLYHVQLTTGNLISNLDRSLPYTSEVQIADVPGRFEPGTGEVNWTTVARRLKESGFSGDVGLEGWASGDSDEAIAAFVGFFD